MSEAPYTKHQISQFRARLREAARSLTNDALFEQNPDNTADILNDVDGCSAILREFVEWRQEQATDAGLGQTDQYYRPYHPS